MGTRLPMLLLACGSLAACGPQQVYSPGYLPSVPPDWFKGLPPVAPVVAIPSTTNLLPYGFHRPPRPLPGIPPDPAPPTGIRRSLPPPVGRTVAVPETPRTAPAGAAPADRRATSRALDEIEGTL